MSATAYGKLNEEEQKTLVARFLRENMVEPFQYLWTINKHVTNTPEGNEYFLFFNKFTLEFGIYIQGKTPMIFFHTPTILMVA